MLKNEVERLSLALEEATTIINENTTKYIDFSEQLNFAEQSIEKLFSDNKELKMQIIHKETLLNEQSTQSEYSNQEFCTLLTNKKTQIDQLKNTIYKQEVSFKC